MVVVYCSDENYVQHLFVSVSSLYYYNNSNELLIYILDGGISDKSKAIFKNFSESGGFKIIFVTVDISLFDNFLVDGHISRAAYYRISIPDLLPEEHKRALYLDCDIVLNENIDALWNQNLQGHAIAAVPEFDNQRNIEMGLGNTKTFNSGVLLLDLKKWRTEGIAGKVLDFIKKNPGKIKFHDQDALNAVLVNDWLQLPIKWNLTFKYIAKRNLIQDQELLKQIDKPAIIHFNESFKPWHFQLRHPYKYLYKRFLKKTPFKEYSPPDRNLRNILRKCAAIFLITLHLKKQHG
jgi:lipopolysaccharide biosynthesis glycosyltransferase